MNILETERQKIFNHGKNDKLMRGDTGLREIFMLPPFANGSQICWNRFWVMLLRHVDALLDFTCLKDTDGKASRKTKM
jgi:hypothetical protein